MNINPIKPQFSPVSRVDVGLNRICFTEEAKAAWDNTVRYHLLFSYASSIPLLKRRDTLVEKWPLIASFIGVDDRKPNAADCTI